MAPPSLDNHSSEDASVLLSLRNPIHDSSNDDDNNNNNNNAAVDEAMEVDGAPSAPVHRLSPASPAAEDDERDNPDGLQYQDELQHQQHSIHPQQRQHQSNLSRLFESQDANHNNYFDLASYNNPLYNATEESSVREELRFDELPSTCEEGRTQLEISFALENWSEMGNLDHVVETLSMYPNLAAEQFMDVDGVPHHPLAYMMLARSSAEVILEVYNIYPEVLSKRQGHDGSLPLHIACLVDDYDDVIVLLAERFPLALAMHNEPGLLPIHCAMAKNQFSGGQKASFSIIRTLIGLHPQSVALPSTGGLTPLDYAVLGEYDIFVLYYILERSPLIMPKLHIPKVFHGHPVVFNETKARVLGRILPHFRSISLDPSEWESFSFLYLMRCLQNSPVSTNNIYLKLPPSTINPECRFALKQALELNTCLSHLTITFSGAMMDISQFLKYLRDGLAMNQSLQVLQLGNCEGRNMMDLVFASRSLTSINIAKCCFTDTFLSSIPSHETLQNSKLKCLIIQSSTITPVCLRKLVEGLGHLPHLQDLALDVKKPESLCNHEDDSGDNSNFDTTFDITDPLVRLLQKGNLVSLTLGRYPTVDLQVLCEELKQNMSLKILDVRNALATTFRLKEKALLDVLANYNTSLEKVKLPWDNERILYYTMLNAFGRTKARNLAISRADYIELVCAVAMINIMEEMTKCSLEFGLLREKPNVWALETDGNTCLSPRSRKRRREDGTHPTTSEGAIVA